MGACLPRPRPISSHDNREACEDVPAASSSTAAASEGKLSASTISTATTEGKFSTSTVSSGGQSSCSEFVEDKLFPNGRILPSANLRIFTLAELRSATKNFRPDMLLGQGGFGKVYKAWVHKKTLHPAKPGQGMPVAVKRLNSHSMQGWDEWQSEVHFLGRLSHPNLVKLLGYCTEDEDLLLVYEFMAKGSLENHLFRRGSNPLSWDLRLKIAIDAARGLAFLHAAERKIIYRDFKGSNILLDTNYNAKISDFGMAKDGPQTGESHVTTRVMGTFGYAAPEYVNTGHLYVKSDVYGFGVVLLELLCGQKALDVTRSEGKQNLVEWVRPMLLDRKKLVKVMDPQIEGQYSSKALSVVGNLALTCLTSDPKSRPSMDHVVEKLEEIRAMKCDTNEKLSPPKPGARNRNGTTLRPERCRSMPGRDASRSEERRVHQHPPQSVK